MDIDTPAISLKAVSRTFAARGKADETAALTDINLHVARGSFTAIIGPSGCGKSTLLRIMAGLDQPDTGTIHVDGHEPDGPGPDRGVVFQQPALFPWKTVRGNAALALENVDNASDQIDALLERVGLTGFADHLPSALSGGMQQRAALARTLAADPDIMLLDEPFGALDQHTRSYMQDLLARIWQETGKTMILITHDIEEAIYLSDRVLVMSGRPGTIIDETAIDLARPREWGIKSAPEFQAYRKTLSELLRDYAPTGTG